MYYISFQKRRSESLGKRPIQATIKMDCSAYLRFYVMAGGDVVLKEWETTHCNHAVSNDIFIQDYAKATPYSVEVIKQMLDGKRKVANIQTRLNSEGIYLSKDQIRYQADRILGKDFDIDKLGPFCKELRKKGGVSKLITIPKEMFACCPYQQRR